MSLKEKVMNILMKPRLIMKGDTAVGARVMREDEAEEIYKKLVEYGLLEYYGAFESVTEHYGIVRERNFGNDVFCVFLKEEPVKDQFHVCFGSTDRPRAERECRYLETMNYGGSFYG